MTNSVFLIQTLNTFSDNFSDLFSFFTCLNFLSTYVVLCH